MKPATVSRRAVRAAVLERVRNLPAEEFGECELCGFMHNRPLERSRCPVCGGDVCRGEPVCGCGASVGGGEYNALATEKAGNTWEGAPARGDIFTPRHRRS